MLPWKLDGGPPLEVTFDLMTKLLVIGLGGGIGAVLRYGLSGLAQRLYMGSGGGVFPIGTLAVNSLGGLLIGGLWVLFDEGTLSPNTRLFVFIGLLGGFTTFSTYSLETLNLIRGGELRLALANIFLSNLVCIVLAYLGFVLTRAIIR